MGNNNKIVESILAKEKAKGATKPKDIKPTQGMSIAEKIDAKMQGSQQQLADLTAQSDADPTLGLKIGGIATRAGMGAHGLNMRSAYNRERALDGIAATDAASQSVVNMVGEARKRGYMEAEQKRLKPLYDYLESEGDAGEGANPIDFTQSTLGKSVEEMMPKSRQYIPRGKALLDIMDKNSGVTDKSAIYNNTDRLRAMYMLNPNMAKDSQHVEWNEHYPAPTTPIMTPSEDGLYHIGENTYTHEDMVNALSGYMPVAQHNRLLKYNEHYRDDYARSLGYKSWDDAWETPLKNLTKELETINEELASETYDKMVSASAFETAPATEGTAFGTYIADMMRGGLTAQQELEKAKALTADDFLSGFDEGFNTVEVMSLGYAGIGASVNLYNILEKVNNGQTLSEREEKVYRAYEIGQELEQLHNEFRGGKKSRGRRWGQGVGTSTEAMAQFAASMAATGGIGSGIAAANTGIKQAFKQGLKSGLKQTVKMGGKKAGVYGARSAAAASFSPMTYSTFADRRVGQYHIDESGNLVKETRPWAKDLGIAYVETFNEYFSEYFGNGMGKLIDVSPSKIGRMFGLDKWAGKKGYGNIGDYLDATFVPTKRMREAMHHMDFAGFAWEAPSEAFGDFMNSLMLAPFSEEHGFEQFATKEYWEDLYGTTAIFGGSLSVLGSPVTIKNMYNTSTNVKRREAALEKIQDVELRNNLKSVMSLDSMEEMSQAMVDLHIENLSPDQAAAAVEYLTSATMVKVLTGADMEDTRLLALDGYVKNANNIVYKGKDGSLPSDEIIQVVDKNGRGLYVVAGDVNNTSDVSMLKCKTYDAENRKWVDVAVPASEVMGMKRESVEQVISAEYQRMFGTEIMAERLKEIEGARKSMENPSAEVVRGHYLRNGLKLYNTGEEVSLADGRTAVVEDMLADGSYLVRSVNPTTQTEELYEVPLMQVLQPEASLAEAQKQMFAKNIESATQSIERAETTEQSAEAGVAEEEDVDADMEDVVEQAQEMPKPVPTREDGSVDFSAIDDSKMFATEYTKKMGGEDKAKASVAKMAANARAEASQLREKSDKMTDPNAVVDAVAKADAMDARADFYDKVLAEYAPQEEVQSEAYNAGDVVEYDGRIAEVVGEENEGVVIADARGRMTVVDPTTLSRVAEAPAEENAVDPIEEADDKLIEATEAGIVQNVFGKMLDARTANVIDAMAKALGVKVAFVESVTTQAGTRANADIKGNVVRIAWAQRRKAISFLAGHEFTHRMKDMSPEAYAEFTKSVKEYLGEAEWQRRMDAQRATYESHNRKAKAEGKPLLSYEDTLLEEEVVADFVGDMVENRHAFEHYVQKQSQKPSLLQAIKKVLSAIGSFFRRMGAHTEAQRMKEMIAHLDTFINKARKDAKKKANTPTDDKVVTNKKGDVEAVTNEKTGQANYSLSTYREGGRGALADFLDARVAENALTSNEAADMMQQMDDIYEACTTMADKYEPFGQWSEAKVVEDKDGNPVFSVIKANGDYAMNLDFSLVCKKRRTLDAVLNNMVKRGMIKSVSQKDTTVAKINAVIRKYGFETACALCFVDARRFQVIKTARQFCDLYNDMVDLLIPKKSNIAVNEFNFANRADVVVAENGLETMSDDALNIEAVRKIGYKVEGKKKDGSDKYGMSVMAKIARHLVEHPEDRKHLSPSDFVSTAGFDRVKEQKPAILSLYNAKKGTGGPKAAFSDVQYLNDIIRSNWKVDEAYAVGGVRLQSFSDYVPRMVFDYIQMVAELAAKKLPVHAYTKEALFAKTFGLTGMKINLSLVPDVVEGGVAAGLDAEGNYVWKQGETFPYEEAIALQNAEGYRNNCGTIAVGVSDAHILKMLDDDNIRMVIPYHKSGLPKQVAKMNNVAAFTDYTNVQNTTKDGKAITKEEAKEVPNYNELLREHKDARKAAQAYVDWCAERGYTPKFAKFANHPNYYKLLEDFTTMVDGKYAPQEAVTFTFPTEESAFGGLESLIEQGLEEDAVLEGQRDVKVDAIVEEVGEVLGVQPKFSLQTINALSDALTEYNANGDITTFVDAVRAENWEIGGHHYLTNIVMDYEEDGDAEWFAERIKRIVDENTRDYAPYTAGGVRYSISDEKDENGYNFVLSPKGTTIFGEIREESGLPSAPIKLSLGFQSKDGIGYGLEHIEANHGEQIRNAGFNSVVDFVNFVANNYDEDNIKVGKKRAGNTPTYLIQVVDAHENTLFIELSQDGSYWNVNSGGIFRKGYSNKRETVAKTEPQQPNNAFSTDSSLSDTNQNGILVSEPNGESTVSTNKDTTSISENQTNVGKFSLINPEKEDIRYSVMQPTDEEVTFDNFFQNTSALWSPLPIAEKPSRDPDYKSMRWDGSGVSSQYWYGEDDKGKYVVRGSDHWSYIAFTNLGKDEFDNDPYNKRYGRIATCRWGLDATDITGGKPFYEVGRNFRDIRAEFDEKYNDGGIVFARAYLDEFTKWEDKNAKFSLIGEIGAANIEDYGRYGSPMFNLEMARELEAMGKSAKKIRLATNWERGADGKWRFEIMDGTYNHPTDDDVVGKEYRLADILDNDYIFEAYPDLADMTVVYDPDIDGWGAYNGERITLNPSRTNEELASTLLHEVQHAIQHREMFARGGNESMMEKRIAKEVEKLQQEFNALGEEFRNTSNAHLLRKGYLLYQGLRRLAKQGKLEGSEYEAYRRLAGEVEARNVQKRMGMSEYERLNTMLEATEDVARKDQEVLFREAGVVADAQEVGYRYSIEEIIGTPSDEEYKQQMLELAQQMERDAEERNLDKAQEIADVTGWVHLDDGTWQYYGDVDITENAKESTRVRRWLEKKAAVTKARTRKMYDDLLKEQKKVTKEVESESKARRSNASYAKAVDAILQGQAHEALPIEDQILVDVALGQKLRWEDEQGGSRRGLKTELGLRSTTAEGMAEVTGGNTYIEDYVAAVVERNNGYENGIDDNDVRNAVIEVFGSYPSRKAALAELSRRYPDTALYEATEAIAQLEQERDEALAQIDADLRSELADAEANPSKYERAYEEEGTWNLQFDIYTGALRKARNEVSRMERDMQKAKLTQREKTAAMRTVKRAVVDMLKGDLGRYTRKRDIQALMDAVNEAQTLYAMQRAIDKAMLAINELRLRKETARMNNLLKMRISSYDSAIDPRIFFENMMKGSKNVDSAVRRLMNDYWRGVNSSGVDVAKGVDGDTARVLQFIRKHSNLTAELGKAPTEGDILKRCEAWRKELRGEAVETSIFSDTERKEIEALTPEVRERMADAVSVIEGYLMVQYQLQNMDEGVTNARQKIEAEKAQIKKLNKEIKALQEQKVSVTDGRIVDAKKEIEERKKKVEQINRDIASVRIMNAGVYIGAMPDILDAFSRLNAQVESLLMGGRVDLADFRAKRDAHKRELVNMVLEALDNPEALDRNKPEYTAWQKAKDTGVARFFTNHLGSLDYMLRSVDRNAPNGEGMVHTYFTTKLADAKDAIYENSVKAVDILNSKAQALFGTTFGRAMRKAERKVLGTMTMTRTKEDGTKITEEYEMTVATALYTMMMWNQPASRPALENMGATEEDIEQLRTWLNANNPAWLQFAGWVVNDFLPSNRARYNEVYRAMNGTDMDFAENYFPIRRMSTAIPKEVDLADPSFENKPSTVTGAIMKRTENKLPIDLETSFFGALQDNIVEMEEWSALAPIISDFNAILSSPAVKKAMGDMGKYFHNDFQQAAKVATLKYAGDAKKLDGVFWQMVYRTWASTKLAFKAFTALKQLASSVLFLPYSGDPKFIARLLHYYLGGKSKLSDAVYEKFGDGSLTNREEGQALININWALENSSMFRRRWDSGVAGNDIFTRELKYDSRTKAGRFMRGVSETVDKLQKWGMAPIAFIDAYTVSAGMRAIYEYELANLTQKEGYTKEEAKKIAMRRAEMIANKSQQSSEGEYLAPLQMERGWMTSLTMFQNAPFAQGRNIAEAWTEITRKPDKEYAFIKKQEIARMKKARVAEYEAIEATIDMEKELGIITTEKQENLRREKLQRPINAEIEAQAHTATKKKMFRAKMRAYRTLAYNAFRGQFVFNLMGKVPYLLFGDDEEEKKKMWIELAWLTGFAPASTVVLGGQIMSILGGHKVSFSGALSEFEDEWNKIISEYKNDGFFEAMLAAGDFLIRKGFGVDYETFMRMYAGIENMFESGMSAENIFMALNAPDSQVRLLAGDRKEGETAQEYATRIMRLYSIFSNPEYSDYYNKKFSYRGENPAFLMSDYMARGMKKNWEMAYRSDVMRNKGLTEEWAAVLNTEEEYEKVVKALGFKANSTPADEAGYIDGEYRAPIEGLSEDDFYNLKYLAGYAAAVAKYARTYLGGDEKTYLEYVRDEMEAKRELISEYNKILNK